MRVKVISPTHSLYNEIIEVYPYPQDSQLLQYWQEPHQIEGLTTYINYNTIHANDVEPAFNLTTYQTSYFE